MSSPHPYQNPTTPQTLDDNRWIIHIRRALDDDDLDQESDQTIPSVSIFTVPKTLKLTSPESYAPQQIALGPYHHCRRPDLYEMERHKLAAAKTFQKHFFHHRGLRFHDLVAHLAKFEPSFRARYKNYLNISGETLAWLMAVDSCFLLEFLRFEPPSGMMARDAVVRDVVMLENQIPFLSLRKVLEFQLGSGNGEADDALCYMLIGFCGEVSPFNVFDGLSESDVRRGVAECAHLLEFLYRRIVPEMLEGSSDDHEITISEEAGEKINNNNLDFHKVVFSGMIRLLSKPVKFLLALPWKIVSNLPAVIMIRQIEYLCFSQGNKQENENCHFNGNNSNKMNKHPLMEEIAIPSVTELWRAGMKFSATNSGILGIKFDEKTATFYLPNIALDVNTEVVMRNLVAYEVCGKSGPLIFTRYTELMNGIVDTEDDAKLLRENGIVLNHLKSDGDAAELWNGMSKSIRLTKVPFLDRVIEDVNGYYNGRWRVRIGKFLRRHFFESWHCMTLLAAVLLLSLMSLQVFSSLFGCARLILHRKKMN